METIRCINCGDEFHRFEGDTADECLSCLPEEVAEAVEVVIAEREARLELDGGPVYIFEDGKPDETY